MSPSSRVLGCILAFTLMWAPSARATTIDPLLFEELILGADFVGVVECERAGGIVAYYKVVESWKGPKVGTLVSIRTAVNYWEPQYPIALCGERYFMTAYKEAPSRVVSTTSGGGVPLWWRDIPADYRLPLFQGRQSFDAGDEKGEEFGKKRKSAQTLLALKPSGQELALLRAVIEKDLFGERWLGGERDAAKAKDLRAALVKLPTPEAVADELLRLAKEDSEKWLVRVGIVFRKAGRDVTLGRLQKLPIEKSPWDKQGLEELIKSIKGSSETVQDDKPRGKDLPAKNEAPAPDALAKLRKSLSAGPADEDFGEAFELLARHDPGLVSDYLIGWQNAKKDWRDSDRGYVLGSYFAWRCGKDRKKYLTDMLDAKDPYIRVAGAVYLCYEDAEAGIAVLKKFTTLDGDPGVWAALTLARRGQKDAVPRMLEVFKELPAEQNELKNGMAGVPRKNLQKRVLELLSNSAKAGGVSPPSLPKDEEKQLESLSAWWKQHVNKVVLQDPWLEMLAKQKVD